MMEDDTLWIAGRARGVVEGDRLPLILRHRPFRGGIALGEKRLVVGSAQQRAADPVIDFDERRRTI
jgi:hypothetical protein